MDDDPWRQQQEEEELEQLEAAETRQWFENFGERNGIREGSSEASPAAAGTYRAERFGQDVWGTDDRQRDRRQDRGD